MVTTRVVALRDDAGVGAARSHPLDWPAPGPIDLDVHDLPHPSSLTEWWYQNAHLITRDGRAISLFASFFRIMKGREEHTRHPQHAHSVVWAMSDLQGGRYVGETLVDRCAPELGRERLARGEGTRDERVRRAVREVLERGKVPYPDRVLGRDPFVGERRLELDYDGLRFRKLEDGSYRLELYQEHHRAGCDLVFRPLKRPVRHGDDGVVRGVDGTDMFYYFIPRCEVTGTITLDGLTSEVMQGTGWYDHEFGGHREEGKADGRQDVAWDWTALQLDDGSEVTAYSLDDLRTGKTLGHRAVVVDPEGRRTDYEALLLTATGTWRSARTFNDYPTRWRLEVPGAGLALDIEAAFADQEMITVISKPAFWEGACYVQGTRAGHAIRGIGYVERSGHTRIDSLDDFFGAVGEEVRRSVRELLPLEPTFEQVRDLVTTKGREYYLDGVDIPQLTGAMARPVREIVDRGGKSWRSYAALACCDIVGGDSRKFVHWLAMPELMHVGSLIVDDVQDKSSVRRGGPACHVIYGEGLAINAGTACYFMGQNLLRASLVSDADKIRLYDLYFGALRAGHAGQALDIDGLHGMMPEVVENGDGALLEERILAIHRLKTAAPAGALSRMGAVAGGGTHAQIEGVGRFFESVGLAFQIVDDVLNLRGFRGNLKSRGEDLRQGKITLPVAKALSRLPHTERSWLWEVLRVQADDDEVIAGAIERLEACGALDACMAQANELVEQAWRELDPLVEDSLPKIMLRAFGWYVLERHY